MLSHHLAKIHLVTRIDEELATVLQLVDGIGIGSACLHRNHRTVDTAGNLPLEGLVLLETVGHDGLTLTGGEHIGTQTDDTSRRDIELDIHPVGLALHRGHLSLAAGHHINHLRGKLLGHIDGEFLNGFTLHPVDLLVDNLGLPHLQLVALAAHGLDEHGEMEHTAAADNPLVGAVLEGSHAQGEVLLQLFVQTVVDMAAGHKLALLAEEGGVIDGEKHRHGGLIDGDGRQRLGILEVTDGISDLKLLQTDDGTDVATLHLCGLHMTHPLKGMEFLDAGLLARTIAMGNGDIHTLGEDATVYTSHGDTSGVTAVVQRGDEHLGRTLNHLGSRNHLYNLVEQIMDIGGGLLVVLAHPVVLGRTIDHGEIQLVFGGIEREHEVEHHLVNLLGTAVGFVHLVDHYDGLQPNLQRLLQHETGLRHGSLKSIDEEQTAVCHVEHTLHLASEVRVTRGVYDIDFYSFPIDGYILGEDGDTSLALQVVAVQHLTAEVLTLSEEVSCEHHLIDQCSLSMVYVGDDGNVSNVLHLLLPYKIGCKVTVFFTIIRL